MDFYRIRVKRPTSNNRQADYIVYPDFKYASVKDLVCKGGDMYAFWAQDRWNTNIDDLILLIDKEVSDKVTELQKLHPDKIVMGKFLDDNETKIMKEFSNYTKLLKQSEVQFNTKILFSDQTPKRGDYSTSQLSFTPKEGDTPAFDQLMHRLYSPTELEKILWFIGALYTNNMPKIQKFMYLYGGKGSGKGTVIKIFKMLFEGYYATIDLMTLTSGSEFATSQIQEVPLLVDDDSDLSRIVRDTNLLKLTAHEPISVNAKYKQTYDVVFNGLLITASNQRFKVRNIDSGITRRAVVVTPTSFTHDSATYFNLMERIKYELPMIAQKAIEVFNEKGEYYYENYMDVEMAEATDHIFSFVRESAVTLGDEVTLQRAAELYKLFLEDYGYETKGYKRKIKTELLRYFHSFHKQKKVNGENVKNVFSGFKRELVFPDEVDIPEEPEEEIRLDGKISTFDIIAADYPAQLANSKGTPSVPWDKCTTTLKDIDTSKLHYVLVPLNHIIMDFDLKDENGEKDLERNLRACLKFPPTYTELSKSGKGVHRHYIYDGDVSELEALYEDDIEIKIFTGKQSLRRKLTKFNEEEITHITTGLPKKQKGGVKVYQDVKIISWNEKKMRTAIKGNLEKKYHGATKPSMDFIAHIFQEAERTGVKYDLRDLRQDILIFATRSTNQSMQCLKIANSINYSTIDNVVDSEAMQQGTVIIPNEKLFFYDVEVFPNLFVLCVKRWHTDDKITLINPTPEEVEKVLNLALVGFNNRRYDNHIMYGAFMGENNLSLYRQSQRIINGDGPNGMYSGAYELSYADIYEYAATKQSLKKWEIQLGIKHDELELPWNKPVPEEMWPRVAEYCMNDVIATEAVFDATAADYNARCILATLSGLKINATTQQHAAKFLFGDDPRPQDKFVYTDLSKEFPGYTYSYGKSLYRGEDPKEGGYVHAEPGIYSDVALLDVASMHPNSLIKLNYFGPYTQRFADLVQARIYIKHKEFDKAGEMFEGVLKPFLTDETTAGTLGYAMKIIINIVYGMTSAKFDNKFRHKDNADNIVAKRGALFMIDLKHAVQEKGFTVAHIKTDSIKIPNATKEIIEFVMEFGKKYGYEFEHEDTYSKFALVNKAVYIAEHYDKKKGEYMWTPTGAQFAEPYVFKSLFSHEEILEEDYALTKQATAPIYLGDRFVGKIARVYASITGEEMFRVSGEKKSAITGTKNYRWRLMSEYIGKEDIDMKYYYQLVTDAVNALKRVGDISDILPRYEDEEDLPF